MQRIVKLCLAAVLLAGTAEAVAVEKKRGPGRRGPGRKPGRKPETDSDLSREDRMKAKICGEDADCQAAFDAWVVSDAYTVPQAAAKAAKQAACERGVDMANAIKQFKCDNDGDDTDACELATYDKCTKEEEESTE